LSTEDQRRIREGAAQYGVILSPAQVESLGSYAERLLKWSKAVNLTGHSTLEAIIDDLILPSLIVSPHIVDDASAIDVGSGAGIPGVPIAIIRPDINITLLEPRQKRAAFIRSVANLFAAKAVVREERVEDITGSKLFDIAMSRAVFPLAKWIAIGRRLVKQTGVIAAWTSEEASPPADLRVPYDFGSRSPSAIALFHVKH
jgi:16S rRNA (guanine527-N7)-methyltransferase